MDFELTFEQRPGYLYVQVTGSNQPDTVARYLRELLRKCRDLDCFRVLIDERLEGPRLDVGDVFAIASQGAMDALGVFQAIAYVDTTMGEMADFAENVAINRGMPVKTFNNVANAERWLLGQQEGPTEKHIFSGVDAGQD